MKSQLYLWEPLRQKYIGDLTLIKTMFIERIQPIFANAEKEANDYRDELWSEIVNSTCSEEDAAVDPSDYVEFVQEKAIERYEMLSLMHYRNIGMWIECLCQVWEQQICSFVIDEAKRDGITYEASDMQKGYGFAKAVFKEHQQTFEQMESWDEIRELRLLVNVLKHAEGDSEQKLRKLRPDYFTQDICGEKYDLMSMYHTSLLESTLKIQEEDFIKYYNALVAFWKALPERMYSNEDIQ